MVDINRMGAMRPFPFVVFPERAVIVKFTALKTVREFFFSFPTVKNADCVAGKDRQAMADPEGADHFSVVMDMFDEFDSCLCSQANGLGMEWPFKTMAQFFSKLWERRRQAKLLWSRQAAADGLGKEDIAC
jgi:hypothetical protein